MARFPLTVTIITLNEEENIARAIQSVSWASEIIVIDSGSTDKTVQISQQLGARVIHNPWPGYGQQKNFAQKLASFDWVLNLDADEEVSAELKDSILDALTRIQKGEVDARGFCFPRKTFYLGRWIRHGGWYPNYTTRLGHRSFSSWTEPSVHETLQIQGKLKRLEAPIHHYAFSSIQEQVLTNLRFSHLGSQELKKAGKQAHIGRLIFKPIGKFIETFLLKRGFLDGLPGFIISVNAAHSMFLKYAYLSEEKLRLTNGNINYRQHY